MISVVITSYKEPKTIGRAVEAVLKQLRDQDEVIVVAPDDATLQSVPQNSHVRTLRDQGRGKPAALNLAFQNVQGSIVVLTDGDMYMGGRALGPLLKPFADLRVGAVTGRPVPQQDASTKFGFWARVLTDAAHRLREIRAQTHGFIECSGYLMAVRRNLFLPIPEEALLDDVWISQTVWNAGKKIVYAPEAKAFVKFASTFHDWVIQKTRTIGGSSQSLMHPHRMRSFWQETIGVAQLLRAPKSARQFGWLIQLFFARLYVWMRARFEVRFQKRSRAEVWQRVDSTK